MAKTHQKAELYMAQNIARQPQARCQTSLTHQTRSATTRAWGQLRSEQVNDFMIKQ